MSDSLRPRGLQPTRLLCPWDFPGKSTGVGYREDKMTFIHLSILHLLCAYCVSCTMPDIEDAKRLRWINLAQLSKCWVSSKTDTSFHRQNRLHPVLLPSHSVAWHALKRLLSFWNPTIKLLKYNANRELLRNACDFKVKFRLPTLPWANHFFAFSSLKPGIPPSAQPTTQSTTYCIQKVLCQPTVMIPMRGAEHPPWLPLGEVGNVW